ncbi:MAG: NAD(P)H-dependent flavin oxidoreductase [Aquabacterium sp.]
MHMPLPSTITRRLRLPLIAAPMFRVSGPDLVLAACRAGVIGAFPTANCRSVDELDAWLHRIRAGLQAEHAAFAPNLIMRRATLRDELACLVRHRVELVITSVGSPAPAVQPLHDIGCVVLADVASVRHAEKAIEAGADGLILLSAGAGGQTGWANGFAFARAVRAFFDGPLVMAGGMADGHALWAAQALGCDLAYMGTRFIATQESMASAGYKRMLVDCRLDDVMLTRAFTGLETNMLRPSIVASGLDPDALPEGMDVERTAELYGAAAPGARPRRWTDIWSAGHAVSGVGAVQTVADLVQATEQEYRAAQQASARITQLGR